MLVEQVRIINKPGEAARRPVAVCLKPIFLDSRLYSDHSSLAKRAKVDRTWCTKSVAEEIAAK